MDSPLFEGKPYGPECIKVVTGEPYEHWVITNGAIDKEATAERDRKRAEAAAFNRAAIAANEERRERNRQRNWWIVLALSGPCMNGDFVSSTRYHLATGIQAFEDLSERAQDVVAQIYARGCGRKGSKAYARGLDEFYERLEQSESMPEGGRYDPHTSEFIMPEPVRVVGRGQL